MKRFSWAGFLSFCLIFVYSVFSLAIPGKVVASFSTPAFHPSGLAFDGKYLWLADHRTAKLYKIDPTTGRVAEDITSPAFIPGGLAFDGKYLWIVDGEGGDIFKLDPKTGVTCSSISAPSRSPRGLSFDGNYLWVIDDREDKIYQLDTGDGTIINTIPAPYGYGYGLSYDGRYLYVSDRARDRIYLVSPDNGAVIMVLPAPGPFVTELAYDGKYLWCVDYQTDMLYKLDLTIDEPYVRTSIKEEEVELLSVFRNHGPGTVTELDVYFAVPQNLPNQEIIGEITYSPKPVEFLTDKWGQKVAHFKLTDLKPGSFLDISMKVKTQMYDTRWFIDPDKVGSLDEIPGDVKEKYLVDEEKLQINDPYIKRSVRRAVGSEKNPYFIACKIMDYIGEKLHYEMIGGWDTAPTVLKRGSGSCSEYSFVYISMLRSAGIPARYVGAICIRGEDASIDVDFHRWVEVYLPGYGWVRFDAQAGDQPIPADKADAIAHMPNRYLITTIGGGDSEYLAWSYNFNLAWKAKGRCKVVSEQFGLWSPLKKK
jgi:transglutaminase-like putative cysteine protease